MPLASEQQRMLCWCVQDSLCYVRKKFRRWDELLVCKLLVVVCRAFHFPDSRTYFPQIVSYAYLSFTGI